MLISLSFKSFHPGLRLLHSLLKKFCQFTSFYLLMTCDWLTQVFGEWVCACAPAQLTGVEFWKRTVSLGLKLAFIQEGAQGPCPQNLEWYWVFFYSIKKIFFTMLCWFPPYNSANQSRLYLHLLPPLPRLTPAVITEPDWAPCPATSQ